MLTCSYLSSWISYYGYTIQCNVMHKVSNKFTMTTMAYWKNGSIYLEMTITTFCAPLNKHHKACLKKDDTWYSSSIVGGRGEVILNTFPTYFIV